MPFDTFIKDKSLKLPPKRLNETEERDALNHFLETALYRDLHSSTFDEPYLKTRFTLLNAHIPSYQHHHKVDKWLSSHYRFQMDILFQAFQSLMEQQSINRIDPDSGRYVDGFDTCHFRFLCCHDIGLTPRPDPYAQYQTEEEANLHRPIPDAKSKKAQLFYHDIKKMLEKIYYKLTQDKTLTPIKVKELLTFLNLQMGQCGPGIYGTLQEVYRSLSQAKSIAECLEEMRDNLVSEFAGIHINRKKVGTEYKAHVHTEFQRMTLDFNFPILKAKGIEEHLTDRYALGAKISERDVIAFKEFIHKGYTRTAIIETVTLHMRMQFIHLKGIDLSDDEQLRDFEAIARPFLDADIFKLSDVISEENALLDERFFDKLTGYTEALLIHLDFIHAIYPKILLDIIVEIKRDVSAFRTQLSMRSQAQIASFENNVRAVADMTCLSDKEKTDLTLYCIHDAIQQYKHRPRRLRFINKLGYHKGDLKLYRAFKALKERFLLTHPDSTLEDAFRAADRNYDDFEKQLNILYRNQCLIQLCEASRAAMDECMEPEVQFALSLLHFKDKFGRSVIHFDKRDDNDLLIEAGKAIKLEEIDTHFIVLGDSAFPTLKKAAMARLAKGEEIPEIHYIDEEAINLTALNYAINLERIIHLSHRHEDILNDSWLSPLGVDTLMRLHPILITLEGLRLLTMIDPNRIEIVHIEKLNDFVLTQGLNETTLKTLAMILKSGLSISHLPLISKLNPGFITEESVHILSKSHTFNESLIERLNEAHQELETEAFYRLTYLQKAFDLATPWPNALLFLPRYFYQVEDGIKILNALTPLNDETVMHLKNAFTLYRTSHPVKPNPKDLLAQSKAIIQDLLSLHEAGLPLANANIYMMLGEKVYNTCDGRAFLSTFIESLSSHTASIIKTYLSKNGSLQMLKNALCSGSLDLNVLVGIDDSLMTPSYLIKLLKEPIWFNNETDNKTLLKSLLPLIQEEGGLTFMLKQGPDVIRTHQKQLLKAIDAGFKVSQIEILLKADKIFLDNERLWHQHLDKSTPHPFGVPEAAIPFTTSKAAASRYTFLSPPQVQKKKGKHECDAKPSANSIYNGTTC